MAENASDAIIITAEDNNEILFANRQAEELTGYNIAELQLTGSDSLWISEKLDHLWDIHRKERAIGTLQHK